MAHRILVVDGAVEGLARIQAHLQSQGHSFTWALNAEEALDTLAHESPDVIIVDAGLTDGNALELIAALRKSEARNVPIILATRKGNEAERAWAKKAPVDEVLEKPFETAALTVCVRQLLRFRKLREELELRKRELAGAAEGQRGFVEALVHDLKNPIAVVHVNLA
jgi:DNA-binding response OmpR family regulator